MLDYIHTHLGTDHSSYYVEIVVVECMWPWYGVHITVCMALLVGVLCQPVQSLNHPIHRLDLFLEIFLYFGARLVSDLF